MANPIIEGTQIPINIPACLSPLNHKISENIRDKNADININLSVVVNFLNMDLNLLNITYLSGECNLLESFVTLCIQLLNSVRISLNIKRIIITCCLNSKHKISKC